MLREIIIIVLFKLLIEIHKHNKDNYLENKNRMYHFSTNRKPDPSNGELVMRKKQVNKKYNKWKYKLRWWRKQAL